MAHDNFYSHNEAQYFQKVGYPLHGIYVMCTTRRST